MNLHERYPDGRIPVSDLNTFPDKELAQKILRIIRQKEMRSVFAHDNTEDALNEIENTLYRCGQWREVNCIVMKWRNEMEQEKTTITEFAEGLNTFFAGVAQQMAVVAQQVMPVIKAMYDAIYVKYRESGMPYGDSDEGCMRWITERHEAQRLMDEATRILDHHEGLTHLRRRLAESKEHQVE